ncbi:exopolysaccharide production repressor protein, partial [Mesorhizobium sp. 98Argb]
SAVVKTLTCALFLQAGYFASVLFLIRRSARPGSTAPQAKHLDGGKEVRRQLAPCREEEE